ncbi:glycoside hydrolase family 5 protein [Serpula lacrymans var. lacrymans S7.3]|uniref:Glycoside hydrolase family 5 protein n=1 Tax=Serpula lacrymans var. lacrymans (strain S7.3) TaxID=936435 RepID=F8PJJ7_SERL3|nr:glycoside hydrolase family 5 protein [Serpula lacrymans var. lacrymans S7.3]
MNTLKHLFHGTKGTIIRQPKFSSATTHPPGDPSENIEQSIYRYRKQHGVNLGSWFVLERWITEYPFRCAASPGQSDLDIARGEHAKEILELHWDTWITEADFAWLARRGINAVRIPIGYYHLCGADPTVLEKTDFSGLEPVFEGAWHRIMQAISTAQRYGIGVLFDLHAAPGKQNRDSHSGTSSSNPTFFQSRSNLQHGIRVLRILIRNLLTYCQSHSPPLYNVVGVELLNEPQPPSHKNLQRWYIDVIRELRAIDPGLPIYISDCWMTEEYTGFIQSLPASHSSPIVALDHHLYRCFTSSDIATPAAQHSGSLSDLNAPTPRAFAEAAQKLGDASGGLVVGEWSGALNPGSLHGADEYQARKNYISAQLALFERYCAGWFFWTYKKEHKGDCGWSFRDAVEGGVFPNYVGVKPRNVCLADTPQRQARRGSAKDVALGTHKGCAHALFLPELRFFLYLRSTY